MARAAAISPASVQRLWAASDIKPHLSRTFKLSNDKRFEEKFWDVIGLYLNPPDKALVLCCDEKSQCQALERTQPGLPLGIGHIRTKTHDYVRHGTLTLFAELNYLEGKLITRLAPRPGLRRGRRATRSGSPFSARARPSSRHPDFPETHNRTNGLSASNSASCLVKWDRHHAIAVIALYTRGVLEFVSGCDCDCDFRSCGCLISTR